jgi:hypothetical protein
LKRSGNGEFRQHEQPLNRDRFGFELLLKSLLRPIPHPGHFDGHDRKPETTTAEISCNPPVRSLSEPTVVIPSPQFVIAPTPMTALSSVVKLNQVENIDGPEHKFQVNEQLLYEHEFHGSCYVSAHLQRLQHGVFGDPKIHRSCTMHVTFVAVTFIFHPSMSLSHRFQSAIIEVTACSENNEQLRFAKFAPHLAYGRISTETLKWTFSLGATVGVSKGPVNAAVNPSMAHQRDKVLGTMMKIQGSTRSQHESRHHKTDKIPDTRLVWSLEENDQQETGLPREFTFVFLVARTLKAKEKGKRNEHTDEKNDYGKEHKCLDHGATFAPMQIGINVKPHISNMNGIPLMAQYDETLVADEVGQRLVVEHTQDGYSPDDHASSGYYNFAKMPGNFEDLIELPGNSVTSVVRQRLKERLKPG